MPPKDLPAPGPDGNLDPEVDALLRLSLTTGVGPGLVHRLLDEFESAVDVFGASRARLCDVAGVGAELAARLADDRFRRRTDAEIRRCREARIDLLAFGHANYPSLLPEIHDPPPILYLRGDYVATDAVAIAIVGTRRASRYGLRQAQRLAASLSRAGVTVISGLARGIDAAAHRSALESGGRTLAVLAGGLQQLYPPEHVGLADAIAEQGAVLSEVALQTKPRRGAFPRRNRLISGLSLGVVVVEAAARSGAMITARHALDQGREVYAVPGPVEAPGSRGCHQLLRDGAKLVESVDDILEELGPLVARVRGTPEVTRVAVDLRLNDQERAVLGAIDDQDVTQIDHIVTHSRLPVSRVLATLSVLEMRRLIDRLSADRVVRRA